ncbi:MAG: tetratricopeptide repeat protein [Acidobacteriota bacterium]|nr:tetratricopeptide repeat protein [Acidobacteriota bacterium]
MNRRAWRAALAASALLTACLPCAEQARGQERPAVPGTTLVMATGTVYVSVRNEQGTPLGLPSAVSITIAASGGPIMQHLTQKSGGEWEFQNLRPGVQYTVKVEAPGYRTAEQYVDLPYVDDASARVEFYLLPAKAGGGSAKPAGGAILAPRAQKEVQQGIKDLEAKKISSAQKHLAKALKMAPGNPLVNYLMGESWLRAGKVDEAIRYLEKAISLDPKQTQALLALGTVRYQQGDKAKAIELFKRAVESAPQLWQGHWLLADAYLRGGNYQQAREQAELAVKYGKEQADPARLILGVAQAKLGKRDEALGTFRDYLKRYPKGPRAEQVREIIKDLQQPPRAAPAKAAAQDARKRPQADGQTVAAATDAPTPLSAEPKPTADLAAGPDVAATTLTPPHFVKVPAREDWAPADVDDEKPERISNATCPLPRILRQSARNAEELVNDLQKFSATENFEEVEISRAGQMSRPTAETFSYLVFIHYIRPHLISIDEMRTPSPAVELPAGQLISTGSAALALVFHPDFANDFDWKCKGMGEWKGQPTWLIHFRQRADRPTSRLHGFEAPGGGYILALKGLAWVAANGNQVLHLETDLVKPVEQARLEREHFAINYGLVTFMTHPVALWLPKSVDTYWLYQGRSYHEYSRFSNFQLFWVGTAQEIGKPKQSPPKP